MIHVFRWTGDIRSLGGFSSPDVSRGSNSPLPRKRTLLLPLQAGGEQGSSALEPDLHLDPGGAWTAKRNHSRLRLDWKCLRCLWDGGGTSSHMWLQIDFRKSFGSWRSIQRGSTVACELNFLDIRPFQCCRWDYSASFINKFGDRPEFQLPDRSKWV